MGDSLRIDGAVYEISQFSEELKKIVAELIFVQSKLNELQNNLALLSRAKNGYMMV